MLNVVKVAIKQDNKYLILKRNSKKKLFPNAWDFPGGKIDDGEDIFDALKRECMEETRLKIDNFHQVVDFTGDVVGVLHRIRVFTGEILSNNIVEIILSPEHTDYKWATKEEIEKLGLDYCVELFLRKSI